MNQKHFVIGFVAMTVVAVGILGFTKLREETGTGVLPSPDSSGLVFEQASAPPAGQKQVNSEQKQIKQYKGFPVLDSEELKGKKIGIQTNKGVIKFEIYPEATKAASNFLFLTKEGFYNGLKFHRVEPRFVIQGGDPLGNGTGGPGYSFSDEPVIGKYDKGVVAMANSGPDTNGSQFFIMLSDTPGLPPKYTIFGRVYEGMDVVGKIAVGDVMDKVSILP